MRGVLSIAGLLALLAPAVVSAQQTDVIRGRVTGADSLALQDVSVKATSYHGNVAKTATTDKAGRFTIVFINGEGDYWLDFTKIGYAPKRFEIKRIGDEDILIADTRLSAAGAKLAAVDVVGQRNRALPSRTANSPDVGGGDRALATSATSADQAGNLAALAASVAGIQLIPGLDGASDMFSMLGLSGDQNSTTFDGLGSGVSALPPDILANTSIRPYPFDVSVGGFSGAQVSIQTIPGSNFSRRLLSSSNILPALQWGSQSALAQGQKFTDARIGGNAAGPIVIDRAFYNTAYNVGRTFSRLHTLFNTDDIGLAAAGVAPDSSARLLSILRTRGVPYDRSGLPSIDARDYAQASANIDLLPSASGSGHSFTIGGAGNFQRTHPLSIGGSLLSTPNHTGDASFWGANALAVHTNYFWFGVLSKTTLGLAESGLRVSPFAQLPEGNVRVGSSLPDGTTSVKSLFFGGSPLATSQRNRAFQLSNQLLWYSLDNTHTIKLTSSVQRDAFTTDVGRSLLGTFSYNSLADLEANRPSAFTRTLGATSQSGSQIAGSISLGDSWRPTPNVQVQYGVRADGNRFLDAPAANSAIESTFGIANGHIPNRVYFSPRIGVQWYYGESPQIAYAPGAARPPRAVIHAGAGIFQNIASSSLIANVVTNTGLPNATRSITCVGIATPTPDWSAFLSNPAAIPDRCADGSDGSVLGSASPNVTLFDARFRQAQSLRAAADWSGPVLDNRFVLGVQSILSAGVNQQTLIDVNLDSTARFTLADESRRPVYVDPSRIVPATGAVAIAGSRRSSAFQHVWDTRSDLRLWSKQLTLSLKPVTANPRLRWDLSYTLLDNRETFSGFTSTAGNPFATQWGPHLQAGRHAMSLTWSDFPFFDVVYVSAALRVMSGQRFTPMIAGDVNGDGLSNDRAFIASPASDTAMRSLLAHTTSAVRECLTRQLGMLAARGSCRAPWTANAGMIVKFNPQKIGLPKRATVTLQLQNPLALADLALHGSDDLRGWGQALPPDQNLLFVRGFDASTRRFKYDVNQRFGSTRPQQASSYAMPFVSLGVSVDIGMPRERLLLTQRLNVGRAGTGNKATADAMMTFGVSSIPNPMYLVLQQADALGLTRQQADSLATLSRSFARFADSVWTPAARYLAALPDRYDTREAYDRYVVARERTVDYLRTLAPEAKQILTAQQRRRLPLQVANYLDERVLKFLRSSSAGDASSIVVR